MYASIELNSRSCYNFGMVGNENERKATMQLVQFEK